MHYISIKTILKSENEINLNEFIGSTIRGAIISEISKLYCTNNDLNCIDCKCGMTCPNRFLFNMKHYMNSDRISNPIVLNAYIQSNNSIGLNILLFGIGIMAAESIIEILKQGIYLGKEREQFIADEVYTVNKYGKQVESIEVIDTKSFVQEANKLTVDFISPTHIQKDCMPLEFEHFLRCCMYRYMSLNRLTESECELNYDELLEKAKNIKLEQRNIKLTSLGRFSGRTQTKNEVHCIKGRLVYSGSLTDFLPILQFVENFNIGKWSSMGLGKVKMQFE